MEAFEVVTEEMIWGEENVRLPLVSLVDTYLTGHLVDSDLAYKDSLIDCESPIEQILSMQFVDLGFLNCHFFTNKKIDIISIEKQARVKTDCKMYRVDFLIPVIYRTSSGNFYNSYVVECDGHDYHEKTKEQVANNNKRERELKAAGYEVVRFSGSEIYKSPFNCARELLKIIISKWDEYATM